MSVGDAKAFAESGMAPRVRNRQHGACTAYSDKEGHVAASATLPQDKPFFPSDKRGLFHSPKINYLSQSASSVTSQNMGTVKRNQVALVVTKLPTNRCFGFRSIVTGIECSGHVH